MGVIRVTMFEFYGEKKKHCTLVACADIQRLMAGGVFARRKNLRNYVRGQEKFGYHVALTS